MLGIQQKLELQVVIPVAKLPKDEDFYQFQYVKVSQQKCFAKKI